MIHEVSGHNFHGHYSFTLRGPAEGFILSESQRRKVDRELCGLSDCECGGGYGEGLAPDSARLMYWAGVREWDVEDIPMAICRDAEDHDLILLPAKEGA